MNNKPDIATIVKCDIEARVKLGEKQYGERLTTHNGRDALWDAYEEAVDQTLYLRQEIEERKTIQEELAYLRNLRRAVGSILASNAKWFGGENSDDFKPLKEAYDKPITPNEALAKELEG